MEWKFQLNNFDGPLDVLLALIKEKKMDILNLNVSLLCKQYLAFIKTNINSISIDEASEYLSMASQLILLKSKKVMPTMIDDKQSDFEYERDKLIQKILEYKNVKEASSYLINKQESRSSMFSKAPDQLDQYKIKTEQDEQLPSYINPSVLLKSLNTLIEKWTFSMLNNKKMLIKELSVEHVIKDIQPLLKNVTSGVTFSGFLQLLPIECIELKYIVTTFLALLELAKQNVISLISDDSKNDFIIKTMDNHE